MLLLYTQSTPAAPLCLPSKSVITDNRTIVDHFLKVNQYGDPDRKTAEDFADKSIGETKQTIENRYAATGDFSCGDAHFGQGQVTIKDNIITTAAHVYAGRDNCPLKNPPLRNCKFTAMLDGKTQDYAIESVVNTGYKCSSSDQTFKVSEDWIILKLKDSVDSRIRPYPIDRDPTRLSRQKNIVHVSKSHDFNPTSQTHMRTAARHYGRCELKYVYGESPRPTVLETDCDSSGNSSGGSILTPGANPELLAITSGSLDKCGANNKTGSYQHGCWSSVATPVSGEFFESLNAL